jgi:hypothetical protein
MCRLSSELSLHQRSATGIRPTLQDIDRSKGRNSRVARGRRLDTSLKRQEVRFSGQGVRPKSSLQEELKAELYCCSGVYPGIPKDARGILRAAGGLKRKWILVRVKSRDDRGTEELPVEQGSRRGVFTGFESSGFIR